MIAPDSVLLEQVSLVTPMAIRFWDHATRSFVSEGLDVVVRPASGAARPAPAIPNRQGVFVARGLPGLRSLERGAGDDVFWEGLGPGTRRPFVIDVVDRRGRFLPWSIAADLPARGLVHPDCLASFPPMPGVPLFSSSARPAVPGAAIVRIELDEVGATGVSRPARWAIVQVKLGSETAVGLTDERGMAAIIAPYPKPPGNGATAPLSEGEWPVELRVFYTPDATAAGAPVLCRVLAQKLAPVFRDRVGADAFSPQVMLHFGRELVLADGPTGKLFVRPTA